MKDEILNNVTDIDAALTSPSQATVRKMVRALPEDVVSLEWRSDLNEQLRVMSPREWIKALRDEMPSLAWRSELNERLLAVAQKKRSPMRVFAWFSTASALGVCVAAFLMLSSRPVGISQSAFSGQPTLNEEVLIAAHVHSVSALDLGVGTFVGNDTSKSATVDYNWNEADVGQL